MRTNSRKYLTLVQRKMGDISTPRVTNWCERAINVVFSKSHPKTYRKLITIKKNVDKVNFDVVFHVICCHTLGQFNCFLAQSNGSGGELLELFVLQIICWSCAHDLRFRLFAVIYFLFLLFSPD